MKVLLFCQKQLLFLYQSLLRKGISEAPSYSYVRCEHPQYRVHLKNFTSVYLGSCFQQDVFTSVMSTMKIIAR